MPCNERQAGSRRPRGASSTPHRCASSPTPLLSWILGNVGLPAGVWASPEGQCGSVLKATWAWSPREGPRATLGGSAVRDQPPAPDPLLSGSGSVVNSLAQGPQPLLDLQALPVNSMTLG